MSFPKGNFLLKDAAIQFVNFDNILNQSKKAREGHLTGYIEIKYPDSLEYLFLRDGNAVTAAGKKDDKFEEYPLEEVIGKAKKAHQGIVNIYQIEEDLLSIIISLFKEKPLFANLMIENINLDSLFKKLKELNFRGFLALNKKGKYSFVKFRKGKPDLIYPIKKNKRKVNLEILIALLKNEKGMLLSAYKERKLKEQANPALIGLYIKFFNSLIKSFTDVVGHSFIRKTLIPAYENASMSKEILKNFRVADDLSISYKPFIGTDEEITIAFAIWIDQFTDGVFVVLGRKTDGIIYNSIKDYRFALKSAGFFEYSKLSRLDI